MDWTDWIVRAFWTVLMGYGSVVEWKHVYAGLSDGRWPVVVGAGIAAIALGFIAAESALGRWP